jgi:hypothetical protein
MDRAQMAKSVANKAYEIIKAKVWALEAARLET